MGLLPDLGHLWPLTGQCWWNTAAFHSEPRGAAWSMDPDPVAPGTAACCGVQGQHGEERRQGLSLQPLGGPDSPEGLPFSS